MLYVLGVKVVSRVSLRGMSDDERASRISQFSSTLLSRALLVLYIAYPGARAHRAGRLLRASASRLCSPVPAEWLQV